MKKDSVIYLDVCTLSRPFDDQSFLRIRIETEAVNLILTAIRTGKCALVYSPVHINEIEAIDDRIERIELLTLLSSMGDIIHSKNGAVRTRAEELVTMGFGVADAAHVAFAEKVKASFISCDDKLIKHCLKHGMQIWCGNPVAYCEKEGLK